MVAAMVVEMAAATAEEMEVVTVVVLEARLGNPQDGQAPPR